MINLLEVLCTCKNDGTTWEVDPNSLPLEFKEGSDFVKWLQTEMLPKGAIGLCAKCKESRIKFLLTFDGFGAPVKIARAKQKLGGRAGIAEKATP